MDPMPYDRSDHQVGSYCICDASIKLDQLCCFVSISFAYFKNLTVSFSFTQEKVQFKQMTEMKVFLDVSESAHKNIQSNYVVSKNAWIKFPPKQDNQGFLQSLKSKYMEKKTPIHHQSSGINIGESRVKNLRRGRRPSPAPHQKNQEVFTTEHRITI